MESRTTGAARAVRAAALALGCAVLSGCDGCGTGPETPDAGPGAADAGAGACRVLFTYRPTATATAVGLVGEWDGFDRQSHVMTDADGDGTYELEVGVDPGFWAYTFLQNGGEHADPNNSYVKYVEGRAWSGLRLADCRGPILSVEPNGIINARPAAGQGSFTARVRIDPGVLGGGSVQVSGTVRLPADHVTAAYAPRALTAAELTVAPDGLGATVQLSGLVDGKYTVRLQASDGVRTSEPLLLPFWIEAEPFSFRDGPLYMMVTDRFRDGDPSNNGSNPPLVEYAARFQGGDLKGVELSIREGYFDALGVRSIWLTPWQTQPQGNYPDDGGQHQVMGYHGYWPVKAREVEPRLGGAAALHAMVEEAHRHGIRIVMDTVVNHVHEDHEYLQDPAKAGWFRTGCVCGTPGCSWDDQRLSCLFKTYMPDVNWSVNEASEQFIADVLWWMEEFDIDGLRVDAVKHVEDSSISNLTARIRGKFETAGTDHYMFGEIYSGDYGLLRRYIGPDMLDAQLDHPLYLSMPSAVFATDQNGLRQAWDRVEDSLREFQGAPMVTFIGNHDEPRFITKADPANASKQNNKWGDYPGAPVGQQPYDRLWLALVHLMTTPGVPLLYYGDEYGEFGAADPDCRHMMNREPNLWAEQRNQLARTQKLLQARRSLRGLGRGPIWQMWCNSDAWGSGQGTLYAYARPDSDPREGALVVLNLTYNTWTSVGITFPDALGWPAAGTVRDWLTDREYGYSGGGLTLDVPARGAVILGLK